MSAGANQAHPPHLVIGAGPAGVSAALRLQQRGLDVLLVDQAHFPRDKVCGCCLNLAALQSLEQLDCAQLLRRLTSHELKLWELRAGARSTTARLPGGLALNRGRMDEALVNEAMHRGIDVRMQVEAKIEAVSPENVTVALSSAAGSSEVLDFQSVVFATGLRGGGVSNWLPYLHRPTGPIGVGAIIDPSDLVAPQTIYMLSGADGYVGLVQLEDGRVDLAAAIRRPKQAKPSMTPAQILARVDGLLLAAGFPAWASEYRERVVMTPPLTRKRRVGYQGLLAVGDAACYVEPFTGEGMAWAIQSGIAAADCIADHVGCGSSTPLGEQWVAAYEKLATQRQWICRSLAYTLGSERLSRLMLPAIQLAPWIAKLAIKRLNRA